jgi:penicillin-binding protein A
MPENKQNSWRNYQHELQRVGLVRRIWRRLSWRALAGLVLVVLAICGFQAVYRQAGELPRLLAKVTPVSLAAEPTSRKDIGKLLDRKAFNNLTEKSVELPYDGQSRRVETTLDVDLQRYLLERIDRVNSRYVGIVVMEATTGRVLAMPGFDRTDPESNPCLDSKFPAASIFKIVTAAAAVDQCGYTADSPMHFTGNKHTLYKRQLANKIDRYATTIPFREAFAQSVNPVFGKIGGLQLQRALLESSAEAFGFNETLDFELALPPSHFHVTDEPYQWAELASGFNRDTTISPIHGAMMASAVLNAGRMVTPSIIERIDDDQGEVLYRLEADVELPPTMSAQAAAVLRQMMEDTVSSGTARKAFRHLDNKLAYLQIGGKTGSIDSASHDLRYDWFVGYAREPQGARQIVMAIVVAHEKFIGIRAAEYARMAITRYFSSNHAARAVLPPGPKDGSAAGKRLVAPRPA